MRKSDKYIPALGREWLTPLYDPLIRWAMPEAKLKTRLVDQAQIEAGHHVLDLGCGTGTLAVLMKHMSPQSEVVGLDADAKILEIARWKADKARVSIAFDLGMAFELPYPDNAFDHVLSSFVLHHLTTENKARTFKEVYRILRPGGKLSVLDLGRPHGAYAVLISLILRRFEETLDNLQGRLADIIRNAGFLQVDESERYMSIFGVLSLHTARKP
ncbi:MAG: methyltransferase domain-containing protein [Chloroflexi bacterium]|nr:methyltransferase domain-containing protein [candidate division NC10 bacterium]MBI2916911.1 methyltransferase domain-containing protein [Chloroflexota bacterium]